MVEAFVPSALKAPGRKVWIMGGDWGVARGLLVFLDGELYLDRVGAASALQQLHTDGQLPPVISVFVSSNDQTARHADYVCDPAYAEFVENELVPFFVARHPALESARKVLIGLSLSGLAAAHAALTTSLFSAAVCQSPSFWWEKERLALLLPAANRQSPAFWVSVGDLETESGVSHPPSGVLQETSQRDSCGRVSAALARAGYLVAHRKFGGGHDPACWRDDLMLAIPWAMSTGVELRGHVAEDARA